MDSRVMPNKEGGYAPNYTPVAATDGAQGFIVDCDVIGGPNEHNELLSSMDRIEENSAKSPSARRRTRPLGRGSIWKAWKNARWISIRRSSRPSRSRAIPPSVKIHGGLLPNKTGRTCLAATRRNWPRVALCTMRRRDMYFCPMGKEMPYRETKKERVRKARRRCGSTPARTVQTARWPRSALTPRPNAGGRSVVTGTNLHGRGCMPRCRRKRGRQLTTGGCTSARRSLRSSSTSWSVRQFLLRGMEKVRTEWCWVCTAYNLKKLIAAMAALRAAGGKMPASSERIGSLGGLRALVLAAKSEGNSQRNFLSRNKQDLTKQNSKTPPHCPTGCRHF